LRAIVPVENVVVESLNSPGASNSLSVYHAFASASKASSTRINLIPDSTKDVDGDDGVVKSRAHDTGVARQSHRLKWIRLLSEIRRYQAELDEVLCLKLSSSTTFLFQGSMISALTFSSGNKMVDVPDAATLSRYEAEIIAGLD
jgi:hypothetical protein